MLSLPLLAILRGLALLILLGFLLPLETHALWWLARADAAPSWSSTGLLTPPKPGDPALVRVYAARVGRWRGIFAHWPGPNSNTFAAHVMARIPGLCATLPPTALGKDWTPPGRFVERTPSGTGVRLGLGGYAGVTLGWVEGIEVNFPGLVAGLDLRRPAVKLPGWGRIGLTGIAA